MNDQQTQQEIVESARDQLLEIKEDKTNNRKKAQVQEAAGNTKPLSSNPDDIEAAIWCLTKLTDQLPKITNRAQKLLSLSNKIQLIEGERKAATKLKNQNIYLKEVEDKLKETAGELLIDFVNLQKHQEKDVSHKEAREDVFSKNSIDPEFKNLVRDYEFAISEQKQKIGDYNKNIKNVIYKLAKDGLIDEKNRNAYTSAMSGNRIDEFSAKRQNLSSNKTKPVKQKQKQKPVLKNNSNKFNIKHMQKL